MTAAPVRTTTLAVEASRLVGEVRGIGRYVRALLPRLAAQRPDLRLALYVKGRDVARMRAAVDEDDALRGRAVVRPLRALGRARADVVWYPWNIARPAPPRGAAVVVTVHDVAPLALAQGGWRHWRRNRKWRRKYGDTAARATLVVADSTFTAREVHRLLRVPMTRIRAVPLAADDTLPPTPGDEASLEALGVRPPFALTVGADEGRKNLALLDRAMPAAVAACPALSLVLVGPRTPAAAARSEPTWKRTLGFVSEPALAALYRAASCVVVPSTYEGFGLPVLEAMRHGAPVVCARTSSLPEVGGDAVVWVEPDDAAGLAAAVVRLVREDGARAELRAAGTARAARFSWDETARLTLAAFDEAARASRPTSDAPATAWARALTALRQPADAPR